ncbi:hypothetical protein ABT332_19775 [Saccharomonospora azurea]|uniref:hypothetical protein n=1 Tax=Saccharomonospora azurea TaxID=40988 RepID=UPI0033272F4F
MARAGLVTDAIDVTDVIAAHHEALAAWLSGAGGDDVLDTFREAHSRDFSLVTVDGEVLSGAALFTGLASARGSRPGLRIMVHDVVVVWASDGATLVRFTERHQVDDQVDERVVSALLREDASGGPRWHHVHETAR